MAPNLVVRSDSWQNLSVNMINELVLKRSQRNERASTCEPNAQRTAGNNRYKNKSNNNNSNNNNDIDRQQRPGYHDRERNRLDNTSATATAQLTVDEEHVRQRARVYDEYDHHQSSFATRATCASSYNRARSSFNGQLTKSTNKTSNWCSEQQVYTSSHDHSHQERISHQASSFAPSPLRQPMRRFSSYDYQAASSYNSNVRQQQHLLIRLRQQSYKLNRSASQSHNSSISNLSNSIDLNPSLVFLAPINNDNTDDHQVIGATGAARISSRNDESLQPTRPQIQRAAPIIHESSGLRLFKEKLLKRRASGLRKSGGGGLERVLEHQNHPPTASSSSSPIVRSLSSFSERLSGKLISHFRHSWKHFLQNNGSHQHQAKWLAERADEQVVEDSKAASERRSRSGVKCLKQQQQLNSTARINQTTNVLQKFVPEEEEEEEHSAVVDRRQLTDQWIMRHLQQQAHSNDSRRPKSLEFFSKSSTNNDGFIHNTNERLITSEQQQHSTALTTSDNCFYDQVEYNNECSKHKTSDDNLFNDDNIKRLNYSSSSPFKQQHQPPALAQQQSSPASPTCINHQPDSSSSITLVSCNNNNNNNNHHHQNTQDFLETQDKYKELEKLSVSSSSSSSSSSLESLEYSTSSTLNSLEKEEEANQDDNERELVTGRLLEGRTVSLPKIKLKRERRTKKRENVVCVENDEDEDATTEKLQQQLMKTRESSRRERRRTRRREGDEENKISAREDELKLKERILEEIPKDYHQNLRLQPPPITTSDYWSTVDTSEYKSSYNCCQQTALAAASIITQPNCHQMAPQPISDANQDSFQHQHQRTHPNSSLIKQQQQPMLLSASDQEYYLDVAQAAAALERSQLLNQPDYNEESVLINQQQHLLDQTTPNSLAQLTHTDLSDALLAPMRVSPNLHMATHNQPVQVNLRQVDNHSPLLFQQQHHFNSDICSENNNSNIVVPDEDYYDDEGEDADYALPTDESWRLERSQVELVQMIGEGQKGFVFLGKLQSRDPATGQQHIQDVAIKTLKYETEELIEKLMREAAIMRQFEHAHIIKFLGVCPETPALIAMELAQFGEVKHYLKLNRHLVTNSQLVLYTFQICTALSYLESKQFVHRDVAARNVLVCSHNCVKLADFGLSRNLLEQQQQQQQQQHHAQIPRIQLRTQKIDTPIQKGSDLVDNNNLMLLIESRNQQQQPNYVAVSKGKLPVRWLAPESLAFRRFTSASDVWMFAVCGWELFHFAQVRPWSHIRNNQVLLAIESGERLARPANCPARLYQLMLQCWSYAPVQRPKFKELKQILWSIYLNERAIEQLELERQQERELSLARQQQRSRESDKQQQTNNLFLLMRQQHQQQQPFNLNYLPQEEATAIESQKLMLPDGLDLIDEQTASSSPTTLPISQQQHHNAVNSAGGGYSSNSTTATTCNNSSYQSSPSSSLDSIARRKAQQQQQQQQQSIQQNQMGRFQRKNGHVLQKQRSQGSIITREQELRQQQQQQEFGYMMNHNNHEYQQTQGFDRPFLDCNGYAAGSRTTCPVAYDDHALFHPYQFHNKRITHANSRQSNQPQPTQHFFVDSPATKIKNHSSPATSYVPALKQSSRETRPLSEFRIIREGDKEEYNEGDADIEEEEDDNGRGSGDEEIQASMKYTRASLDRKKQLNHRQKQQQQRPLSSSSSIFSPQIQNSPHLAAGRVASACSTSASAVAVASEPAYEGLFMVDNNRSSFNRREEISMLRPSSNPLRSYMPVGEPIPVASSGQVTSIQVQQAKEKGKKKAAASVKPSIVQEEREKERLADILRSLKMSPMKAKLSYSRQNSTSRSPDGSANVGSSASTAGGKKTKEEDEEKSRQLALHKRLLGHIRLQSTSKHNKQNSNKLQQQQQMRDTAGATTSGIGKQQEVETVDQSLQILESLIGDNQQRTRHSQIDFRPTNNNNEFHPINQSVKQLDQLTHDLSNRQLMHELEHFHHNNRKQKQQLAQQQQQQLHQATSSSSSPIVRRRR